MKKVLERGMAAELTGHLGYEHGDAAASEFPNSRNGSTPKVLDTEVGRSTYGSCRPATAAAGRTVDRARRA